LVRKLVIGFCQVLQAKAGQFLLAHATPNRPVASSKQLDGSGSGEAATFTWKDPTGSSIPPKKVEKAMQAQPLKPARVESEPVTV
jgi:hypothetical protein